MATSLEDRANQLSSLLGAAQGPVLVRIELDEEGNSHTIRSKSFYNGKLEETDGDCWAWAEATVADGFLPRPA